MKIAALRKFQYASNNSMLILTTANDSIIRLILPIREYLMHTKVPLLEEDKLFSNAVYLFSHKFNRHAR